MSISPFSFPIQHRTWKTPNPKCKNKRKGPFSYLTKRKSWAHSSDGLNPLLTKERSNLNRRIQRFKGYTTYFLSPSLNWSRRLKSQSATTTASRSLGNSFSLSNGGFPICPRSPLLCSFRSAVFFLGSYLLVFSVEFAETSKRAWEIELDLRFFWLVIVLMAV